MQSPIRKTIPIPFSDGIQVPIPSGPHIYSNKTWIGRASDGITPRQAFEALSRHATPFQNTTSVDGGTVDIPVIGPVRQIVDRDRLTIVNTTEPGHQLHPGNVHRSIVQVGDDLYVVTRGYGTGILPSANEVAAPELWSSVDNDIRRDLNPYIKPPEAAAEMVRDSVARAGIPSRNNVFEFGFPSSDAVAPSAPTRYADGRDAPTSDPDGVRSGVQAFDTGGAARPATRPQAGGALGLVTGEPMPQWPVAPPIFNFSRRSETPDGFASDRKAQESAGSSIPLLDEYVRYLKRLHDT